MTRLIIANSEKDSNLYYMTHFLAPDDFICLDTGRRRLMFINDMEYARARSEARVDEVVSTADRPDRYESTLAWVVAECGLKEVTVPGDFPLREAESLRKLGVGVTAAPGDFFPEREVKSEEEIEQIRQAQRVNEKGMEAALGILKAARIRLDGRLERGGAVLTSECLKEAIGIEFLRGGCRSETDIVSCGPMSAQPHNSGHGPLRSGQPIVIDLYPRSIRSRFYADMTRTVVKGKASSELRRMYAAVLAAQEAAIARVAAGVKISSLEEEVRKRFEEMGYPTVHDEQGSRGFIHNLGHGVGLDIHEAPTVNRWDRHALKAGSVITIEPGLYYPDTGGIRIEDMVAVTENGCENLTRMEKVLEI